MIDLRLTSGAGQVIIITVLLALISFGLSACGSSENSVFETAEITTGKLQQTITVTGSIVPSVSVDISSQLSGRIVDVLVDFNDTVVAGQALAQLDQRNYEAEVNRAVAALEVANSQVQGEESRLKSALGALASAKAEVGVHEANIERARAEVKLAKSSLARKAGLVKSGGVTADAFDEANSIAERANANLHEAEASMLMHTQMITMAEAAVGIAESELANAVARVPQMQAALEVARFNLEQTRILAPIDGVIINRDIAPGQTVAASLEAPTLFTIAGDLANIAVFARVDEADIGLVKPGQHVSFEVDAFPGRIFAGRVEQVRKSPSMIQNVVTYTVVISAENQDLLLLPGMTSLVRITVLETGELLRIPNAALRFRPQRDGQTGEPGNRVWTLDADGELLAVAITIGAADASHTELIAGDLQAGQQVVLRRAPRSGPSPSSGLKLGF